MFEQPASSVEHKKQAFQHRICSFQVVLGVNHARYLAYDSHEARLNVRQAYLKPQHQRIFGRNEIQEIVFGNQMLAGLFS